MGSLGRIVCSQSSLSLLRREFMTRTATFVRSLGVPELGPLLVPFDPGYDLQTLTGHLQQSHHLMSHLKLSMACWLIADEGVTRAKTAAARRHGIPVLSGGGPFEISAEKGQLPEFFDLCADFGFDRVEAGEGFTQLAIKPAEVVRLASDRGLEVQYELGAKQGGPFTTESVESIIGTGHRWLQAGARQLVVEARESARGVGLFDAMGRLNVAFAERLVAAFGFATVVFEAPTKSSQFALLSSLGPQVILTNVRLEEVLRVEIYRRGLHSDSYRSTGYTLDTSHQERSHP
ncbi:MAG: phosphosulfolactate synthase [Acidimicrobiales bacterium]